MISREEFKNSLGDSAKDLTKDQITKLQDNMEKMSDIFFGMWTEVEYKKYEQSQQREAK